MTSEIHSPLPKLHPGVTWTNVRFSREQAVQKVSSPKPWEPSKVQPQQIHPTKVTQRTHEHISFASAEELAHFVTVLTKLGYSQSHQIFLDEFVDTENLSLMEKNIWLKKRDGKFILSLTQHPELVPLPVAFVTDPKEIFDITSSVLKVKRERDQKQEEDVKEQLAKMFPRILATLPTLRFVFEAPREVKMKHTIKIDSFESDDEIWTIGTVSAQDNFELPEEFP